MANYVMRRATLTKLRSEKKDFCKKCGKKLKINDEVVSAGSHGRVHYHKECYENLFIEVPD